MPFDATSLINTKQPAPRQWQMLERSRESEDYANLVPYPQWAFDAQQWPDAKGPRPTPLPYVGGLINEGATFLFRNGVPSFSVADDDEADAFLQNVIAQNHLAQEYIALAEHAGHQGAIAATWSYDEEDELCPVRLSFLSIPQECRVWVDPHQRTRILMARIQYAFRAANGEWYYHREEWTDDFHVVYTDKWAGKSDIAAAEMLPDYLSSLGDGEGWDDYDFDENPFGMVPVVVIRNIVQKGNPLGEGDCWRAFRLVDRLALAMHGEDRSNQQHTEPREVAVNARLEGDGRTRPGEPLNIITDNPNGPPADYKLLEPSGAAREYVYKSIDKWEELLYWMAGLSRVDPATVSNKGNMTRAVFTMVYARTIATSDRKRQCWGDSGLCVLFKRLLLGLKNLGGILAVAKVTAQTQVSVTWPDYFGETSKDVADTTDRTVNQVNAGLLPKTRAAQRLAKAEKMPDDEIAAMLAELKQHGREKRFSRRSRRRGSRAEVEDADTTGTGSVDFDSGGNNFTD